jgi:hypothetical protein
MTSTVLDVTVLLLCVSASVVVLGGVADEAGVQGPTADEVADRFATETVTVRYRAPEAANRTRTVHATRAELLALLIAGAGEPGAETGSVGDRGGAGRNAFESRARDAVASGVDERTRIDATIPTAVSREATTAVGTADRRAADPRSGRRAVAPIAASGPPHALRPPLRDGLRTDDGVTRSEADRSSTTGDGRTVTIGDEPPRTADVTTAVVSHPTPSGIRAGDSVRIVVRRW